MSETKFEQWANVELMGHQRVVGRCTEESIAGANMLRVDIPVAGNAHVTEFATRYFSSSAIYCITPVTEEVARKLCRNLKQEPAFAWELKDHPKAVTYAQDEDDDNPESF
jgi:hypothetical protein